MVLRAFLVWLLGCLAIRAVSAQVLDGSEFRVNTTTAGDQIQPAVAADAAGRFVVVWTSYQDGSERGIVGQLFDASGGRRGGEFAVNSYTTAKQQRPSVAMDATGDFVVVWEGVGADENFTYGVFGQRFDSAGTRLGDEFHVNQHTPNGQFWPSVTADAAGNFVVVWQSHLQANPFSGNSVYARRYDTSGSPLGPEFLVNEVTTRDHAHPRVAADPAGNFLITWNGPPSTSELFNSSDIWARLYDGAGVAQTSPFVVNSVTYDAQLYPVVGAGGGQFVVAWRTPDVPSFFLGGIAARRVSAAGVPQDAEFAVNTYTTDFQNGPSVAVDGSGNFTIAWYSQGGQDGSLSGIFARRFTPGGMAATAEFQVNTYTTADQTYPAIVARGPNRFLVAWESWTQDGSGAGVYAQAVASDVIFKDGFE
jgi:hypothetical protein